MTASLRLNQCIVLRNRTLLPAEDADAMRRSNDLTFDYCLQRGDNLEENVCLFIDHDSQNEFIKFEPEAVVVRDDRGILRLSE
jgi:hypothetical protein